MSFKLQENDVNLLKKYYKGNKPVLNFLEENKSAPKSVLKLHRDKPRSFFSVANTVLASFLLLILSQVIRDYSMQAQLNQIIIPIAWGLVGLVIIAGFGIVNSTNINESFIIDYMIILIADGDDAKELREYLEAEIAT